jgi:hypothetical protein
MSLKWTLGPSRGSALFAEHAFVACVAGKKAKGAQFLDLLSICPKWMKTAPRVVGAGVLRIVRRILVKDRTGAQFTVIEQEHTESVLGGDRKLVRFVLENGEIVDPVDINSFVLMSTGKKLRRVRSAKERPPRQR